MTSSCGHYHESWCRLCDVRKWWDLNDDQPSVSNVWFETGSSRIPEMVNYPTSRDENVPLFSKVPLFVPNITNTKTKCSGFWLKVANLMRFWNGKGIPLYFQTCYSHPVLEPSMKAEMLYTTLLASSSSTTCHIWRETKYGWKFCWIVCLFTYVVGRNITKGVTKHHK